MAPALVALACLAVTAHAAVRFGVTGGLQWTRVPWLASDAGDVPGPFPDQRTAWTGEAGLTAEVPLQGPWALASDLAWAPLGDRKHYEFTVTGGGLPAASDQLTQYTSLRTIALPVRVELRPGHWRVGLGPEARYLVSAHRHLEDNRTAPLAGGTVPARAMQARGPETPAAQIFEDVGTFDGDMDVTSLYQRWSVAASGLVGRDFPAGRHALRAELSWSQGLTNVAKRPAPRQRMLAAQAGLGLLW